MSEKLRFGPTLQEVADVAGVHRSTASRALNPKTRHLVAGKVAERIEEASRRLGYRPDVAAARLRTGRSRLIGVIVPDVANPVFGPILHGVETALSAAGYAALVSNAGSATARQIAVVEQLIAHRVDGLVLATALRDDPVIGVCLEAGLPTVLVNRAEDGDRVPAVVPDDAAGMRLAVAHLAGLGHRRIAHLAGPAQLSTGHLRRRGFEAAMVEAGLDPSLIVTAEAYTREAGRRAATGLIDRFAMTAVVAANDLLALGTYQALEARGLTCPADISVVGHNDMPLVDMVEPPLTTIRISQEAMGAEAAQLLLACIDGNVAAPSKHATTPVLMIRGSTARPRPDDAC
jgi:LacI family transcriptional regulator